MELSKLFESDNVTKKDEIGDYEIERNSLVTIDPAATLDEAVRMMKAEHVGDLIVTTKSDERPVGIITDRDIALKMLEEKVSLSSLRVADVISAELFTVQVHDDLFTVIDLMKTNGVTRLPVVDTQGKLVGIVTARKITRILVDALEDITDIGKKQQSKENIRH